MEQLDLKTIKKRIQEMQKQSAADLEQELNMARLRYDYRQSQINNLLKLCEHSLKVRENCNESLEPKGGLEPSSSSIEGLGGDLKDRPEG